MSDLHDPLLESAFGNSAWILRRERFYERALGPMRQPAVYHWDDDRDPHIDVYVFGRTRRRQFETLITGGMADRPVPGVPPGGSHPRRIEILSTVRRAEDWAALILREIASLPFTFGLHLTAGEMVQGSRPIVRGSRLRHAILLEAGEPRLAGFIVEGETVEFLRVCFVTENEFELGVEEGPDALADVLKRAGAIGVTDPTRRSVV